MQVTYSLVRYIYLMQPTALCIPALYDVIEKNILLTFKYDYIIYFFFKLNFKMFTYPVVKQSS